jgi:hypothetical protein
LKLRFWSSTRCFVVNSVKKNIQQGERRGVSPPVEEHTKNRRAYAAPLAKNANRGLRSMPPT